MIRYKRSLSYSTEGIQLYNEGYFHGGDVKLENNKISSEFEINIFPEYYDIDNIEYTYGIKNKQVLKNIDTNYGDIQRITNLDSLKTNNYNKNNNVDIKTAHNSKILYGFQKEKQSKTKPTIENKKVYSNNKTKLDNKKVNRDISMHKEAKFINKVDNIYNFDEYIKLYPNSDMHGLLNQSAFQRKDGVSILPKIKHGYTNRKNISIEAIPKIVENRENKKEKSNDKVKNIPCSDHGLNKLNNNENGRGNVVRNETIMTNLYQIKSDFDLINSITKLPKNKNKPSPGVKILGQENFKNKAQITIREKLKEEMKPKKQEELKEKIKIQEKEKTKKQSFYRVILDKIKKKVESNYIRGIANAFIILIFSYLIIMLLIIYLILNAIRPKIYNNTASHRGSRL